MNRILNRTTIPMRLVCPRMYRTWILIGVSVCAGILGCKDLTSKLPADAIDPKYYQTPEAADEMARSARYLFQVELLYFIQNSGGIADEFRWKYRGDPIGSWEVPTAIDSRILPEGGVPQVSLFGWGDDFGNYAGLQSVRSMALQARSSLRKYAPESPLALQGEVTAYEAFTVVMLADLFCSGVPLTTVDFEGDITYRPGSNTQDLYEHAVALFDTAMQLGKADSRIVSMARIGKGRALLALGRYAEADTVVVGITQGFRFALPIFRLGGGVSSSQALLGFDWNQEWNPSGTGVTTPSRRTTHIADREGGNGLPYLSSNDPRIRKDSQTSAALRSNRNGIPNRFPTLRTDWVIADHIEARLIQAEAALRAGRPEWLEMLNTLRTTGVYTVPSGTDTLWEAGTGGIGRLRPLRDPADTASGSDVDAMRVDLLFQERAYWLFATGHRQGDLRRLIRHDNRAVDKIYPWGSYGGGDGYYGDYVDLPLPAKERINPYFYGCLGRGV